MTGLPDIQWYRNPELSELTPLTVTDEGRVFGHVAGWDTAHVSFPGRRITPPRSRTDYSLFHTGAMRVQDGEEAREISVGRLIMGCPHAGTELGQQAAADFYADSGAVAATVCAYEDAYGIAIAGAVEPDLDELKLRRFRSCGLSGDWRNVNGNLEMVGVISVGVQGFPIPRARVASGAPLALVAAGAVMPVQSFGRRVDPSWSKPEPVDTLAVGELKIGDVDPRTFAKVSAAGEWTFFAPTVTVASANTTANVTPTPATLAAQIDRAIEARERKAALAAQRESLLAEVDDTAARHAALVASLDDTAARKAALLAELGDAGEVFDVSGMPPQLKEEWLHGKVAAKIAWGTDGDFDRCVVQAKAHDIPAGQQEGMCSNLHREATGGKNPGEHGA